MSSTFFGLEIARSALTASQAALNVVGQNVSNVNTEGYTRQSAELASVNYSSGKSKLALVKSLSIGQGVTIERISQIRDEFLDISFRNANATVSKWNTELSALNDVENIFDETSNDGLKASLVKFYDQLDELTTNTDSVEYFNLVRSGALAITQVLNEYSSQLDQIKNEQILDMEISTEDLNSNIKKINDLNNQIKDQTLRGNVSNELLDMRNTCIDKISEYININVKQESDGTVSITSTGGLDVLSNTFSVDDSGDPVTIYPSSTPTTPFLPSEGKLAGFLNIINGKGSYAGAGENDFLGLGYYQSSLDSFANAFAGTFNAINNAAGGPDLFDGNTASTITISNDWFTNAKELGNATSTDPYATIMEMKCALTEPIDTITYPAVSGTFEEFSIIMISDINLQVDYQKDMGAMYDSILHTAANDRESVMGVSIDEETINMTKFQKAYQAAARFMTVIDETLDVLINRTGVVGR